MTHPFDPAAIEREIDDLLRAAGGGAKRASLLTLIVVHPRERQAGVAAQLDYVFGRRPLRVIRIETGGGAPTSVHTGARCLPLPAGEESCFQEIVYYNGPDNWALDPALWRPLVIRDLPAVVLWLQETAGLVPFAARLDFPPDKIVIDSRGRAGGPKEALRDLALLAGIGGPATGIGDLGWRALAPWRVSLARLFDPPGALSVLRSLAEANLSGPAPADSLLIGLWLAARLGLKHGRLRDSRLEYADAGGGAVSIALSEKSDDRGSFDFVSRTGAVVRLPAVAPRTGRPCEACLLEEIDRLAPDRAWLEVLAAARAVRAD